MKLYTQNSRKEKKEEVSEFYEELDGINTKTETKKTTKNITNNHQGN